MELLGTFSNAKQKVLTDVQKTLKTVQNISSCEPENVDKGIAVLLRLRKETYEDLNQIQHEHLIVRAAEWLVSKQMCMPETRWYWNPRQTGDHSEPDLRGVFQDEILISAEVTTSEKPVGTIDARMQNTLAKLAKMPGKKFYFVRTEAMQQRAETKVSKAPGWQIEVINLN